MVYQFPTEPALPSEALPSLDGDLVIKALEKQFDAARVRRVAAGTESTRRAGLGLATLGYAWLIWKDQWIQWNIQLCPLLWITVEGLFDGFDKSFQIRPNPSNGAQRKKGRFTVAPKVRLWSSWESGLPSLKLPARKLEQSWSLPRPGGWRQINRNSFLWWGCHATIYTDLAWFGSELNMWNWTGKHPKTI